MNIRASTSPPATLLPFLSSVPLELLKAGDQECSTDDLSFSFPFSLLLSLCVGEFKEW